MQEKKVVLVMGYGCELHPRYQIYLSKVVRYAREHSHVSVIVPCGGFTQKKTSPTKSEAMVIRSFLENHVGKIPIILENDSLSSEDNLRFGYEVLKKSGFLNSYDSKVKIIIFCDAIRALKVKMMAEKVFNGYDIQIETHDISPPGVTKKQLLISVAEALVLYLPFVRLVRIGIRKIRAQFI